jgi:uncharacterized phiE125 gp8 family phage protein
MQEKLITAPAIEPITLEQAKLHLRESGTDQDAQIFMLIKTAREWCEHYTGRAFITQTWDFYLEEFPCYTVKNPDQEIRLPKAPLQSITSLKYYDTDGTLQTWDAANYSVDTVSEPARITPAYGISYPSTRDIPNAVVIRAVCGYGLSSAVPESIKSAMKIRLNGLFENREPTAHELGSVYSLLDPYRVFI